MPMTYKGLKYAGYHKVECEQKRCTARDFAGLAMAGRLYIAAAGKLGEGVIEPRLKNIKGALGWWRSGTALLGRAMDAAFQTVPDDQFERMNVIFEQGELDITLPRVRINEQKGSILAVHGQALERLTYFAMRNECAICLKDRSEVKRCELYQALKGVVEPGSWESSTCPYRDEIMKRLEEDRGKMNA